MRLAVAVAVLLVPVAIYVAVIRPRLQARFVDLYADIDSFWARQWARIKAMRSYVIALAGAALYAVPELLGELTLFDWSFLPQPWSVWVSSAVSLALILARAFATTPIGAPPSGER